MRRSQAGEGDDVLSAEGERNRLYGDCYTCAGGDDTIHAVGAGNLVAGQRGNDALTIDGSGGRIVGGWAKIK